MSGKQTTQEASDPRIESVAAEWLVRRNGGFARADAEQFAAWLAADTRHRVAFTECEAAWATLSFPGQIGRAEEAKRQLAARAVRRGQRRLAAAGAALLLVLVGTVGVGTGRFSMRETTAASTVALRPDVQTLPDGTVVELNAGAEIAVDFTSEVRTVRLVRGEALFTVTKNPARPFIVRAGAVSVRAVGTAFAVRHGAAEVGVLVTEGKVAVERTGGAVVSATEVFSPLFVSAGGKVEMPNDVSRVPVVAVVPLSTAEIARALAWRGHRVEFSHTALAAAVAQFNRENRVQITIADADVGRIAISGIFWADDPEGFVRLLESGFNVQARRYGDTITLRSR